MKSRNPHKPNSYWQDRQGNVIMFWYKTCSNDKKQMKRKQRENPSCRMLNALPSPWQLIWFLTFFLQFICGTFKKRIQLLPARGISPGPFLRMRFILNKQSQNTHCSVVPVHSGVDWEQHDSLGFKCVWFSFLLSHFPSYLYRILFIVLIQAFWFLISLILIRAHGS